MRIAMSAMASLGDQHALARLGEIVQHFARLIILNDRAERHSHFKIFTVLAMTVAALAMPAAPSLEDVIETKLQQGVFVRIRDKIDTAAIAAIAAARSALRHKLLTTERNTSVASIPSSNCDFGFVNEHEKKGSSVGPVYETVNDLES